MKMNNYYDSVSQLHRATRLDQLQGVCSRILGDIGIRHFRYEWRPSPNGHTPETIRVMTCPHRWLAHYRARNYAMIDPKVAHAAKSVVPMIWGPEMCDAPESAEVGRFWRDSVDFGLGYGMTVPLRNPSGGNGMFCVAMPSDKKERDEMRPFLPAVESLAFHVQHMIERLALPASVNGAMLTRREREVVQWTAAGRTALQISGILGISLATVLYHLSNAKRKLAVANKYQLTARATALELI